MQMFRIRNKKTFVILAPKENIGQKRPKNEPTESTSLDDKS